MGESDNDPDTPRLCAGARGCDPLLAADPTKSLDQANVAAGEVMFRQNCMACHSPDPSKNQFGPTLVGVIGRSAGTLPRFAYSDALKSSGIVWTEDSLRQWLADNEKLVPGTRMKHVSITDPAAQELFSDAHA